MELPATLQKNIIDILKSLPVLDDTKSRQAFIYSAGLDSQLKDLIDFDKPVAQFAPLLVSTLIKYGELHDGRHALESVLETAKGYVGQDRQLHCDKVLQELHTYLQAPPNVFSQRVPKYSVLFTLAVLILIISIILHFIKPTNKAGKLSIVDINTNSEGFERIEEDKTIRISPEFTLQDILDSNPSIETLLTGEAGDVNFPVIFDIKLLNKTDEISYVKEVKVHIIDSQLDSEPIIATFPTLTEAGHNLVLSIRNYGWGNITVKEFIPLLESVTKYLNIDQKTFVWSGILSHDNNYFVFPKEVIKLPTTERISEKELSNIKSAFQRSGFITLYKPGSGPRLDEGIQQARERYLSTGKGVAFEEFNGVLEYERDTGQILKRTIKWGGSNPIFFDLIFTTDGFDLQRLDGEAAYLPPSHNYDISISVKEKKTVKTINVSQTISPDSAERFTVTMNAKESTFYKLIFEILSDDNDSISSKVIELHTLSFKRNNQDSYGIYAYEQNEWIEIE